MNGFLYGAFLQWKLDLRSRNVLVTYYIVPLGFFLFMSAIFLSVMPEMKNTLISAMTVFAVSMGALIGLPPALAEIYATDVRKAYQVNGVPIAAGAVQTNLSAFLNLFLMSLIIYFLAPVLFDVPVPPQPDVWFGALTLLIAASLAAASIIGLAAKDPSNTAMFSILLFLPSVMLSGIMFPAGLLPEGFAAAGKVFPAFWGYRMMSMPSLAAETCRPLFVIAGACIFLCILLLKRIAKRT